LPKSYVRISARDALGLSDSGRGVPYHQRYTAEGNLNQIALLFSFSSWL